MEVIKVAVVVLLGFIVVSLGKAMFHMSSGPESSAKTVQAVTCAPAPESTRRKSSLPPARSKP